jgi:ribosomal protein L16/L10AE
MKNTYLQKMIDDIIKGRGDAQRVIVEIKHQLKLYEMTGDKKRLNNALEAADNAIKSWFEVEPKKEEAL